MLHPEAQVLLPILDIKRTCVKFLNVPVPSGQINQTFERLAEILGICKKKIKSLDFRKSHFLLPYLG